MISNNCLRQTWLQSFYHFQWSVNDTRFIISFIKWLITAPLSHAFQIDGACGVRWYDHFLSSPSRRLRQKSWLRKSCLTSHFPPKLSAHHWINLSSFCKWCCICICLCFTVVVCICLVGRTFLSKVQAGTLGTEGRWIPCGLKRMQVNNDFRVLGRLS